MAHMGKKIKSLLSGLIWQFPFKVLFRFRCISMFSDIVCFLLFVIWPNQCVYEILSAFMKSFYTTCILSSLRDLRHLHVATRGQYGLRHTPAIQQESNIRYVHVSSLQLHKWWCFRILAFLKLIFRVTWRPQMQNYTRHNTASLSDVGILLKCNHYIF